jgi:hypothetical protein
LITFTWTFDTRSGVYRNIDRRLSRDEGKTWSAPEDLGFPDQPSHPAVFPDGRVVLAWVDRYKTQSIRARLCAGPQAPFEQASEVVLHDDSRRTTGGKFSGAGQAIEYKLDALRINDVVVKYGSAVVKNAAHLVELVYADNATPPKTNSVNYSFTVYPYISLPGSYAVNATSINTNSQGFKVRTHQISVDAGTSVQRATVQVRTPAAPTQVACYAGPDGSALPCTGAKAGPHGAAFVQAGLQRED